MKETEELIELAHQLIYHQLGEYNDMLCRLALLACEVDRTQLNKICKEIIAISSYDHYDPFKYLGNYFIVLGELVKCCELETAEDFLGFIEKLPEIQMQQYA